MTIYTQARQIIKSKTSWASGETIVLHQRQNDQVHIKAGPTNSGRLDLVYQNGSKSIRAEVGYLSLRHGWLFAMDRAQYMAWVKKTGHEIQAVAPRLMCAELRQERAAVGGI